MKFFTDDQTIGDLEIFEAARNRKSLIRILDKTVTIGGSNRLTALLYNPMADMTLIHHRIDAIRFFSSNMFDIPVSVQNLDFIEHYLNQSDYPTTFSSMKAIEKSIRNKLNPTNEFYVRERGIQYAVEFIRSLHRTIQEMDPEGCPHLIRKYNADMMQVFSIPVLAEIISEKKNRKRLSSVTIEKLDHHFRYINKKELRFLLDVVYEYDVFQTLAQAAPRLGFCLPEIVPSSEKTVDITGLHHPLISKAVPYDVHLTDDANLVFITGPNMAGKSTFLKSLGIAVFLAHAGFPVPATSMKISLLSGLSTTINIPDDLNLGYSHFYSEVLRIKKVAEHIRDNGSMLVIFDELFRGTNVKDAFEGSVAVISEFSKLRSCFFAISTHLVEVAEHLSDHRNIKFRFFEVKNNDGMPEYTYQIKEGVTDTRLGMHIIRQEKILETIRSIEMETESQSQQQMTLNQ